MSGNAPRLGVAMIGHGFMGDAHSQAWRVAPHFFDLPRSPEMTLLVGRDAARAAAAAERLGWAGSSDDWHDAITRDDIDIVDICTVGDSHAEIALAALAAGKHVICEKPMANSLAEAEQMTEAAEAAAKNGVVAMVGFTYRRVPAITFARQLLSERRLGEIREVRAQYLQDWLFDPESPLTWRLDKARAGSGALGDIGAHIADMAQYILDDAIVSVSGELHTFVGERPRLADTVGLGGVPSDERGPVTVDDAAWFQAKFAGGARGAFEATRVATGRKNALRIEISGSDGALAFDLERLNELQFYDATVAKGLQGFTRILTTEPEHPYAAHWWPTGHGLGYEHPFSHQVADFLEAIAEGGVVRPTFAEGLAVQRVLDAVERSAADDGRWTSVSADS